MRKRPAGEAGTPAANSADSVLKPFVPGLELPQELIDATAQNPGLLESLLGQFLHDHANDGQAVRQALAAGDLQAAQRDQYVSLGLSP